MRINEITLNPQCALPDRPASFRIGDIPRLLSGEVVAEDGPRVEKINHHPENRIFNKGLEIDFPCYAVYFIGIPERLLVASNTVGGVEAAKVAAQAAEADVPLPQA